MDCFNAAMGKILSVSHEEMQRRVAAYKKQAELSPKERGPKPKARRGHSRVPVAAP
jgi:hypothetical protein